MADTFSHMSHQHMSGKVSAEGSLAISKKLGLFFPSKMMKEKEDMENICLFLMIPRALKMLDSLPQWLPIVSCIKNNSLRMTARAFHGLNSTGLLELPQLLQSLQATLNSCHPQTCLTRCLAFENFHKLYL